MKQALKILGIVFCAFWLLLSCATGSFFGGELLGALLTGWVAFLARVLPQMRVRWDLVASAAVYLGALVAGLHLFLQWLHREMNKDPQALGASPGNWQWRWTLGGLIIVALMFVSGTAAIGIMHQIAWLARSPQPMYMRGGERANRVKCASNLRQIGQALELYAKENGGKHPDDFGLLLVRTGLYAEVFVCPSSNDERAAGNTPAEMAASLLKRGHCSYLYLGRGLTAPVDKHRVLALEPPENHEGDGMNVLYGDGHVDWCNKQEVESLLTKLGVEREKL